MSDVKRTCLISKGYRVIRCTTEMQNLLAARSIDARCVRTGHKQIAREIQVPN